MGTFYKHSRIKNNILIKDNKPEGESGVSMRIIERKCLKTHKYQIFLNVKKANIPCPLYP